MAGRESPLKSFDHIDVKNGANFKMKQYILMHIIIMTAHTLLVSTALITNGMATVLKPIEIVQLPDSNSSTTPMEEDYTSPSPSPPLPVSTLSSTTKPPNGPANHIIVPANNIVVGQNVDDVIILSSQPLHPPSSVPQPRHHPVPNVYVEHGTATKLNIISNKKSTPLLNAEGGIFTNTEQQHTAAYQRWPVIVGINCFQSRVEIALNRTVMQNKLIKAALASTTNTQLFFSSLNDLRFEVLYPAQPNRRRYCKSSFYAVGHVDLGILSISNPFHQQSPNLGALAGESAADIGGVPESLPLQQAPPLQYNTRRATTSTARPKKKQAMLSSRENFDSAFLFDSSSSSATHVNLDASQFLPFMWAPTDPKEHIAMGESKSRPKNYTKAAFTPRNSTKKSQIPQQIPAALRTASSPASSSSFSTSLLNDDNVILHNLWHQANNDPNDASATEAAGSPSDNCGIDDVYLIGSTRIIQFTLLVRTKTSRQIAQADAEMDSAGNFNQQQSAAANSQPSGTQPNFYFERMLELTGSCAHPIKSARHAGTATGSASAENGASTSDTDNGGGIGQAVFEKTVRVDSGDASAQDVHIFFSMPVVVPGSVARATTHLFAPPIPQATGPSSTSMHDVEQISIGVPLRIGMELKNRQRFIRILPLKCVIGEYHVGSTSLHTVSALFGKDEYQENSKPGLPPIRVRVHTASQATSADQADPNFSAALPRLIPLVTDECSDVPALIQPTTEKFVMDSSGTRFKIDFRSFKFANPPTANSRGTSASGDFWGDSVKRMLTFPLRGISSSALPPQPQSDGLFVGCIVRTCTEAVEHLCFPDDKCFEQPNNNRRFRTANLTPPTPRAAPAPAAAARPQNTSNNRTTVRPFTQRLVPATERCSDLLDAIDAQAAKEQLVWSKVLVIGRQGANWQHEEAVDVAVDSSAAFTVDNFADDLNPNELQNDSLDVDPDVYATKLNLLYQLVDGETLCFPLLPFTIIATVFALTILLSLALALMCCIFSRRSSKTKQKTMEKKTGVTEATIQNATVQKSEILTGSTLTRQQTIPKFVRASNATVAAALVPNITATKSSLVATRTQQNMNNVPGAPPPPPPPLLGQQTLKLHAPIQSTKSVRFMQPSQPSSNGSGSGKTLITTTRSGIAENVLQVSK